MLSLSAVTALLVADAIAAPDVSSLEPELLVWIAAVAAFDFRLNDSAPADGWATVRTTCRQTRAIGDSPCETNMQSYEVASDVSTDTGDR